MDEKMKALMESEGFVDKMLSCEEPEQVQALFAENGVELSLEEVKAFGAALEKAMNNEDGEMDEDALEDVAGGIGVRPWGPTINPIIRPIPIDRLPVRRFSRW